MISLTRVSFAAVIAASLFLCPNATKAQRPEVVSDPNGARFITEDIDLFWRAMDAATPETLAEKMKDDYLGKSSGAVQDFVPNRIVSEHELAKTIVQRPERYSAEARERMGRIDSFQSKIRASYYALKYLYPPAVFPNTYFVVGRLNSGGTTSSRGLLIGAEMYVHSDDALLDIPTIVAHEWAHFKAV